MKKLLNKLIWIAAVGAIIEWYAYEFISAKYMFEWMDLHSKRAEEIANEYGFFEGVATMIKECNCWIKHR